MTINFLTNELAKSEYVDAAELEARWLMEKFGEDNDAKLTEAIERRHKGEPLAYILEEKEFYGLTFKVGPAVLIPRPETELIVETVLSFLSKHKFSENILDLGCGSSCIGISILKNQADLQLTAVDISKDALQISKENAEMHKLLDRCKFVHADAADLSLNQKFELIVSNPPYVDKETIHQDHMALSYEPAQALYAENKGLACIQTWIRTVKKHLSDQAMVCFEIGFDQGQNAKKVFEESKLFRHTFVLKDLAGHDRVVVGVRGVDWTP